MRDTKELLADREIGKLNKAASGQNSLGSVGHTSSPQDTSVFDLRALKQRYKHAENVQRAKQEARLLTEGLMNDNNQNPTAQKPAQSTTELLSLSQTRSGNLNQLQNSSQQIKKPLANQIQNSIKGGKVTKPSVIGQHTSHSPSASRINSVLQGLPSESKGAGQAPISPHKTSLHLTLNSGPSSLAVSRMSTAQKNPPTHLNTSGTFLTTKKNSVTKLHHNQTAQGSGTDLLDTSKPTAQIFLGSESTPNTHPKKKSFAGGITSGIPGKGDLPSPGLSLVEHRLTQQTSMNNSKVVATTTAHSPTSQHVHQLYQSPHRRKLDTGNGGVSSHHHLFAKQKLY